MPDAPRDARKADHVVVCLSSGGLDSEVLLEKGARLAEHLGGNLYALHVESDEDAQRGGGELAAAFARASKLGATVFTYRARDVARTITDFAREYDVEHVVLGRPAQKSWGARVLGRASLLDRLLKLGEGLSMVVVNTRAPGANGRAHPEDASHALPLLSRHLSPERVLIWEQPVTREEVLSRLLERLAPSVPALTFDDLRARLEAREQELSTFLDEGIALPHLRIGELKHPLVALGITRGGIQDVTTEEPIEMVWVLLLPQENTPGFMPISIVSRIFQDTKARRKLGRARRPEDAVALVQGWELLHPIAPARTR